MLLFQWVPIVLFGLCSILIGFAWGRRHGRKEGILVGQKEAPLLLRKASLLTGRCVLCQQNTFLESSNSQHFMLQ